MLETPFWEENMICGRTLKDDIENERKLSKHYFPKLQSISQELILYHLPHLLDVEHSVLIHDQYPTCGMFFSQLGPVHPIFQPLPESWPKPSDWSSGRKIHAQNHFPTISQPFPNHFPTMVSPPIGSGRPASPSPRLCWSLHVSWVNCFRCFLKRRSWREWRGGDLTMKPWKTMDWTIEQLGLSVFFSNSKKY